MRGAIRPKQGGGAIVTGGGEYADFTVDFSSDFDGPVYDAGGREVGRVTLIIKTPRDPAPLDRAAVDKHLAVCQQCPHAGEVTTTKRGRDVWTIRCGSKRCPRCAKVSLRHAGRCPEGKW